MRRAARRGSGFTLIELMVVVAAFSVIASIALVSIGRTNRADAVDGFATDVRNVMLQARRRAVATRMEYLVIVRQGSVQYCQATNLGSPPVNRLDTPINWAVVPADCSAIPAGAELVRPIQAKTGARAVKWAQSVDTGQGVVQLAPPALLYFNPDGTVYSSIAGRPPVPGGYTLYLQGTSETDIRRKVLVYPFGGRPRVIDTW